MHTMHDNFIIGFAAWAAAVLRALGLLVFYLASAAAVLSIIAIVMFVTVLFMLMAGIHVMLWLWPLQ